MRYNTKQQEEILEFLKNNKAESVTASQIRSGLGDNVGMSTVYRCLDRLLEDGQITKYVTDGGSARYEYLESCKTEMCFHCKCINCGSLIHMDCKELKTIASHLKSRHGFIVDAPRSVIYGICWECRKEN